MENTCKYVNSIGLLKSCAKNPHINENLFLDILTDSKENESIYICTGIINRFINIVLPQLTRPIVLVTGDTDDIISTDSMYLPLLDSPYIKKWFAQNCEIEHPKIVKMPIGVYYHAYYEGNHVEKPWAETFKPSLDQEADITKLITTSAPFWERKVKCYSTFHFQLDRGDRAEAYSSIPKDVIDYEPIPVPRLTSHTNQIAYAFVASPYGRGIDCHRTWEALVLGCIPIIKSNGMNTLFDDLPVLIVNNWSDVTQELLQSTIANFKLRTFNYDKLTLQYWTKMINALI